MTAGHVCSQQTRTNSTPNIFCIEPACSAPAMCTYLPGKQTSFDEGSIQSNQTKIQSDNTITAKLKSIKLTLLCT